MTTKAKPAEQEVQTQEAPEQMELFPPESITRYRPETPDFYLLSSIVQRLDSYFDPETMTGEAMGDLFVKVVEKNIDYESLDYMTMNRILLLLQHNMPVIFSDVHLENLRAAYFEGFMVGADVHERKSQPVEREHH